MISIGGIGCCLIDIIYRNVDFLDKKHDILFSSCKNRKGLIPGSLVFKHDLEEHTGLSIEQILHQVTHGEYPETENLGGPGIIAMIHASQLMVHKESISLSYEGVVGNDHYGKLIKKHLEESSIHHILHEKEGATPTTIVLSDPYFNEGVGERSFINTIGVASQYTPSMVSNSLLSQDIVFFGGTALMPLIHDNLSLLIDKAKYSNSFVCVTTVYDYRAEQRSHLEPWPLVDEEVYRSIDLLIMDAQEAIRISNCLTIDLAILFFKDKGVGSTIITHGHHPVVAYASSTVFKEMSISEYPISKRISEELSSQKHGQGDTTGCGDNFAGGVIASIAAQANSNGFKAIDIVQAISWGVCSGGYSCLHTGGMFVESSKGEKIQLLIPFVKDYMQQIHYEESVNTDPLLKWKK